MLEKPLTRHLFLSCVSDEFGEHRTLLAGDLSLPGVNVQEQADFVQGGGKLLEKLDDYIRTCDAVIHVAGERTGRLAKPAEVRELLAKYLDFSERFPALADELRGAEPSISYTQWEAWLALYHRRRCHLYRPQGLVDRPPLPEDLQQRHWERLRSLGEDRGTFTDPQHLCRRVLRDLHDLWPAEFPTSKPVLLPFTSLGALFKGREEFLDSLRRNLQQGAQHVAAVVTPQALFGLGGVGKTRLAIEYGWRHEADYSALLFVSADSPDNLRRNLAALCGALVLPEREAKEQEVQVTAAVRWLEAHPGWFLILDNVDSEEAADEVERLLVRLRQGHVVITSRLSNWSAAVQPLELDVLDETSSVAFLLDRTDAKRKKTPTDADDVAALAQELDGLALALEQAGAYIARHRCSLGEYLTQWRRQDANVREWFNERLIQYPRSVATTWETTLAQLDEDARDMLRLVAWLAPEPIPVAMFESAKEDAPPNLSETLARLADYSLIKWDTETSQRAFRVHRLVQDVTRLRTPDEERKKWIERMLRLVVCPVGVY